MSFFNNFKSMNNVNINNSSITMSGNGKVTVNGKVINAPKGSTVSMKGDKVYINGKLYDEDKELNEDLQSCKEINMVIHGDVKLLEAQSCEIKIEGNVTQLDACNNNEIEITGDIYKNIDLGNQCTFKANEVKGDVEVGNMCTINIHGNVKGSLETGNMCTISKR